ncbi:MAG: GntR family transcriptional regulator [Xanthobacteraceae bacterium]|nr:GntR family transcriptional regulator [Xanthobacteraceae bacterium]GIK97783.1 MAG: transcriptional regulator [Alphaproteobacteria bacterium]
MATSLKTIDRPQSLGDRVYLTLREHICSGRFAGGQPLQEASLATQLGVSRTPVREALGRLASEGLLDSEGRSFVVPSLSEADIDDIYELRLLIEPEAVRQVARRIGGATDLAPLQVELAVMTAAHGAGDAEVFMEANYRYRAAWLALVPNQRLLRAIELYADHVRYLRALTLGGAESRDVVVAGLRRLADLLAAGDADGAAEAMRDHLSQAKRFLRAALAQQRKDREPS